MPPVWAYGHLGIALVEQGRNAEGLDWLDRSWQEALSNGFAPVAGNSLVNSVVLRVWNGRFPEIPALL